MKTLQDYIDKLKALNFKEMYEGDFFLTWENSFARSTLEASRYPVIKEEVLPPGIVAEALPLLSLSAAP